MTLLRGMEEQVEKQRDDEIGKIADALNVFKERINAFNHMQRDAREKKISQQGEILSQTQALARLCRSLGVNLWIAQSESLRPRSKN